MISTRATTSMPLQFGRHSSAGRGPLALRSRGTLPEVQFYARRSVRNQMLSSLSLLSVAFHRPLHRVFSPWRIVMRLLASFRLKIVINADIWYFSAACVLQANAGANRSREGWQLSCWPLHGARCGVPWLCSAMVQRGSGHKNASVSQRSSRRTSPH